METEVRPSKRPRTDGERAVETAEPKADGLGPHAETDDSDDCLCPICLDPCTPDRSFALPCCNGQLAEGEAPHRIHKTCFYAYARSVIEPKVANGLSLTFMPESNLHTMLRCARCRSPLKLERLVLVSKGMLQTRVVWPMDQVFFIETAIMTPQSQLAERSLFYSTLPESRDVAPEVDDPMLKRACIYDRTSYQHVVGSVDEGSTDVCGFEGIQTPQHPLNPANPV